MSITFVTGKPGGGKGLVTVRDFIIQELVHGERSIVAAFDLHVEPWVRVTRRFGVKHYRAEMGLRWYLLKKFGKDFGVRKRVRKIGHSEAAQFYLHRLDADGNEVNVSALRDSKGAVTSFDTSPLLASGGQVYVIDEAPMHFGARDWATTSKGVMFYGRQHRHFGDDVILCAQHTKQVESELQRLAQEFWVCTNRGKLRWMGFKQPAVFVVDIYDKPPIGPSVSAIDKRIFKLDRVGLGGCYDTSGGVGITGTGAADIGAKTRGIPWWFLIVAFVLFGVFLVWGTGKVGDKLAQAFAKKKPAPAIAAATNSPPSVVSMTATNSAPVVAAPLEQVFCLGYFRFDHRRCVALLSSGRQITQPELVAVSSEGVTSTNGFFPMKRADAGEPMSLRNFSPAQLFSEPIEVNVKRPAVIPANF